jgi:archaellum component FlaF (FlaF/FlaG flagellin family)
LYKYISNPINNWFVENVQEGIDECQDSIVSKEKIEELLNICNEVLNSIELIDGKIENGQRYEEGKWIPILVDGQFIKDSSVAEKLLPTSSGCFFGSTDYNEYYVSDIISTIKKLEKILNEFDFENNQLIYSSSW